MRHAKPVRVETHTYRATVSHLHDTMEPLQTGAVENRTYRVRLNAARVETAPTELDREEIVGPKEL